MNNEIQVKPLRYFLATPLIAISRVIAYIATIVVGFPIIVLDFSKLEIVEMDFDEDDKDIM